MADILRLAESFPSLPKPVFGTLRHRIEVAKDASTPPGDVLEDRHSFSMVALVSEDYRVPPTHLKGLYIVRSKCLQSMCRDDCRTVVAPAFAGKNFRHLAGTKAKARWNATTTDAPTATDNAKWDPRRVGYYRARFEEETACLRAAARQKRKTDKGPSPESKVQSRG